MGGMITTSSMDEPSGARDSFGRFRVSSPEGLFDNKQLFDKGPLWWSESIVNGSGNATSTHSTTNALVAMHVESGDTVIRQSKTHWNYQPGKSQLIVMTGVIVDDDSAAGITSRLGQFTATDGFFFQWNSTTGLSVVKRKASSDTSVAQADWNMDRLDGTGGSRHTIDEEKEQVYWISYEWLSGGDLSFGIVINNEFITMHSFDHFNALTSGFSSTPNLPLRYEIVSTSGIAELSHICSQVASEGGKERFGLVHSFSTGVTDVATTTAGVIYGVVGIKLKSTHLDATVTPVSISMLSTSVAKEFEWFVALNPTVADDPVFADLANSAVQTVAGAVGNTITGGSWDIRFGGGYASSQVRVVDELLESVLHLGSTIGGVVDEIWLCVRPLANNVDILGTLNWQELS
jgi:hypothetical protein